MPVLSKDAILKATADTPREPVPVPEWGGDLYVKTLTATERVAYEEVVYDTDAGRVRPGINTWAELLVRTLCDESGTRIFEDGDAAALAGKGAPVLGRLYRVAKRLNRIGTDEDDAKNSETAAGGGSSSTSA